MTDEAPPPPLDLSPLTPVQRRMLSLLSDEAPHPVEDLHACLSDDLGPLRNVRAHLSGIRKVLRPLGRDIVCEWCGGRTFYRYAPSVDAYRGKQGE